MKKIMYIMLLFLFLIGCSKNDDANKFKNEYEDLNGVTMSSGKEYLSMEISSNNIIKYNTIEEIIDIIENGTGVIYLGFPECPWCRNMIPALFEAADSTALEEIHYLNMYDVRDKLSLDEDGNIVTEIEAQEGYNELLNALSSILDDYVLTDSDGNEVNTGEKRIYVPIVVFVKDGIIVDHHVGTVDSQVDPYIPLTEEEYNVLINIYKDKILKILNNSCDREGSC